MDRPSLAIIGSGISGMSAGYFLHRHFNTTMFESAGRLGGHTHTRYLDVQLPPNEQDLGTTAETDTAGRLPVDTGFIVFNDRTYPNLIRLFDNLGIASQATEMSFSVRCEQTGIEYSGSTLDSYFAQRRNLFRPSFYRFFFDFRRFARQAVDYLESSDETQTVGEFFRQHRYSDAFYRRYFLPMGSAIWSCPQGIFESFPIRFICQFYHHHGLLTIRNRPQWRVVCGGSAQYIPLLTAGYASQIITSAEVETVRRNQDSSGAGNPRWSVSGHLIQANGQKTPFNESFDHVVMACHADQALRILKPGTGSELAAVLQAFPYQPNSATLHTDISLLPRSRRAWAAWNYHLPVANHKTSANLAGEQATVTYNMNRLQRYSEKQTNGQTFCVTLNDDSRIDPAKIIAKIPYAHPIFSVGRLAVQQSHDRWIDSDGLSLCGAYWGNGFHEDGLNSALMVSRKLLGMDPWKAVCIADGSNTAASCR
ncbi:MAG: FAD-dependent oxidoreductase [Planctomycetaceae bacterium]|nr:FAD-dependent oxidoreductase [Planctomycetaceae bacterium]